MLRLTDGFSVGIVQVRTIYSNFAFLGLLLFLKIYVNQDSDE